MEQRLIAIRARGLVQLRELVLSRDEHVLSELDVILDTCKKNLAEEDEYVREGAKEKNTGLKRTVSREEEEDRRAR
jgi:hypothetical protein